MNSSFSNSRIKKWYDKLFQIHFDMLVDFIVIGHMFFLVHFLNLQQQDFAPTENPKILSSLIVITLAIFYRIVISFKKSTALYIPFRVNRFTVVFTLLLSSMALSSIFAPSFLQSIVGNQFMPTGGLASYFIVFLYSCYISQRIESRHLKVIFNFLFLAGTIVAGIGILQRFGIDPIKNWPIEMVTLRSSSTLGNPVPYGIFLNSTLLITTALLLEGISNRNVRFLTYLIGFVVQFVGLGFSGSRAPLFIAVILVIFLFAFHHLHANKLPNLDLQNRLNKKSTLFWLAAPLFLVFAVIATQQGQEQSLVNRMNENPIMESLKSRFAVGYVGSRGALENRPLLGYGPAHFSYIYGIYRPASHNQLIGWHETWLRAHNEISEVIVTQGLLGLSIYIFLMVMPFVAFLRYKSFLLTPERRPYTMALILIHLSYNINNLFMFHYFSNLMLFITLPTVFFSLLPNSTIQIKMSGIIRLFQICLVALLLTLNLNLFQIYTGNLKFVQAYNRAKLMYNFDSLKLLNEAIELNPFGDHYHCLNLAILTNIATLNPNITLQVSNKNAIDYSVARCRESNKFNGQELYALADNLLFLSSFDHRLYSLGLEVANDAMSLQPTDVRIYTGLAGRYMQLKEFDKSMKYVKIGLDLRPQDIDLRVLELMLFFISKNPERDKKCENLIQYYSSQPEMFDKRNYKKFYPLAAFLKNETNQECYLKSIQLIEQLKIFVKDVDTRS